MRFDDVIQILSVVTFLCSNFEDRQMSENDRDIEERERVESANNSISARPMAALLEPIINPKNFELDLDAPNLEEEFIRFNEYFNLLLVNQGKKNADEDTKANVWQMIVGPAALKKLREATWGANEKRTVESMTNKLKGIDETLGSIFLARKAFWKREMRPGEKFTEWYEDLKTLLTRCAFTEKEVMLRDKIVCYHTDNELLAQLVVLPTDTTLATVVAKCKSYELARFQANQLVTVDQVDDLRHKLNARQGPQQTDNRHGRQPRQGGRGKFPPPKGVKCAYCADVNGPHAWGFDGNGNSDCPAHGTECPKCQRMNHNAAACRNGMKRAEKRGANGKYDGNSKRDRKMKQGGTKVDEMELDSDEDEYVEALHEELRDQEEEKPWRKPNRHRRDSDSDEEILRGDPVVSRIIDTTDVLRFPKSVFQVIPVGKTSINFKIDGGASANVLSWRDFLKTGISEARLEPATGRLVAYNGGGLTPLAKLTTVIKFRGQRIKTQFHVIEEELKPLIGCPTAMAMGFVFSSPQTQAVFEVVMEEKTLPEEILRLGLPEKTLEFLKKPQLGKCTKKMCIELDPKIRPSRQLARRLPFRLKKKVKQELDRMIKLGVIEPVVPPSEWCSPMLVVDKKNGKLRLCLDPRKLNTAIQRAERQIPSVDELLADFETAEVISVLDLESGFWQIPLIEESIPCTTFATPFGRFRFKRCPFGISSAPEEFHRIVAEILDGIPNVTNYIDDIIVRGATQKEHDESLKIVFQRLHAANLTVNPEKCQLSKKSVTVLGHVFRDGIFSPDPKKTEAIAKFPVPKTRAELQRLLGMVNYLRKFVPNCSNVTAPLSQLLKKGTDWVWGADQNQALDQVRTALGDQAKLHSFRRGQPLVLATDASSYGLGAVLMQDGNPVAYTSRKMTDRETQLPQIEKEFLALVNGFEKFYYYTYGETVVAQTDHKPLLGLVKKPIHEMSIKQQRLIDRLLKFDFRLEYVPGKDLTVADALSRAPIEEESKETELPRKMLGTDINEDDACLHELDFIPVADPLLQNLIDETKTDPLLQAVIAAIQDGWLRSSKQKTGQFWTIREDLFSSQGLVFFKGRICIPEKSKNRTLDSLHAGHAGVNRMIRRAEKTVYWPGLTTQVRKHVYECGTCLFEAPKQVKEPGLSIEVPNHPGDEIHADFFSINQKEYVVYSDHFSSWTEVFSVTSSSTLDLKRTFRAWAMRNGIPRTLRADQGSCFVSSEFSSWAHGMGTQIKTSSPRHPKGNSLAELAVKRVKKVIRTAKNSDDLTLSLLALNQTPIGQNQPSPAQIHFGRNLRDQLNLTVRKNELVWEEVKGWKEAKRLEYLEYYNKRSRELAPLKAGDRVIYLRDEKWVKGTVTEKLSQRPRSYRILSEQGKTIERNRVQIRLDLSKHSLIPSRSSNEARWLNPDNLKPGPARQSIPLRAISAFLDNADAQEAQGRASPDPAEAQQAQPTNNSNRNMAADSADPSFRGYSRVGRRIKEPARFVPD